MCAKTLEFLTICNGSKQKTNHRLDTTYLPWKPQPEENQQCVSFITMYREYLEKFNQLKNLFIENILDDKTP